MSLLDEIIKYYDMLQMIVNYVKHKVPMLSCKIF